MMMRRSSWSGRFVSIVVARAGDHVVFEVVDPDHRLTYKVWKATEQELDGESKLLVDNCVSAPHPSCLIKRYLVQKSGLPSTFSFNSSPWRFMCLIQGK